MEIDGPAAEGYPVREEPLGQNVVLVQHIVPHEPPVLPFPRDGTDPLQRQIGRIELAGILDIIPDAIDGGP
ncbi:hypothetical protein D3C71_2011120 [compost metagenome]